MDNPKQQVIDRLKQANNVLVTVSNNPSVDQLSACIALTLMLNKLGKHGTAVFSGNIPSTIEFLKPEDTLEKNTDSLRDFIIALDKSKADKLRYKVEDKVVKIFITPYRTSISEKDFDFSQGDFNVDAVVALGVHEQNELDQAIVSHGRILHDATVISINNSPNNNNIGSINWQDQAASSLSELVAQLDGELDKNLLDSQIATALLTGIVAETNRFSNNKTSAVTMSLSSKLMAAGANQQLVATQLEEASHQQQPGNASPQNGVNSNPDQNNDNVTQPVDNGAIAIDHSNQSNTETPSNDNQDSSNPSQIHIDDAGTLHNLEQIPPNSQPMPGSMTASTDDPNGSHLTGDSHYIFQPPLPGSGGTLTANTLPESADPSADPLSLPQVAPTPLLNRDQPLPPTNLTQPTSQETLTQIEEAVHSPHLSETDPSVPDVNNARSAVEQAQSSSFNQPLDPIQALNAQPVFEFHNDAEPADQPPPPPPPIDQTPLPPLTQSTTIIQPSSMQPPPIQPSPTQVSPDPNAGLMVSPQEPTLSTVVAPNNPSVSAPADEALNTLDMPMPSIVPTTFENTTPLGGTSPINPVPPSNNGDGLSPPPPVPPPMTQMPPLT